MPDVWLARYNRWLEKILNIKGGPSLVDLDPSLTAVSSTQGGVEERYLLGWNMFGLAIDVPAVAANLSAVRVRNPIGSNVVAVFQKIMVGAVATDFYSLVNGPATVDLATPVGGATLRLDARTISSASVVFSQSNTVVSPPGLANTFQRIALTLNTNWDFVLDDEVPLLPGDALEVFGNTVNQRLVVSHMWRERPLEQSELT